MRLSLLVLPANGFSIAFKMQKTTLMSGQEGGAAQGIQDLAGAPVHWPAGLNSKLVAKLLIFSCHQLLCLNTKWTAGAENSPS